MDEVSGPVMAIGLVLCAVFVPVSFMGGITGQLYRQFAITISVSVILSVIVALTLTPALCQMMLRPRKEIRGPLGVFLRGFNKLFNKTTDGYLGGVGFFLRRVAIGLACLAGLWFGAGKPAHESAYWFVPNEDQGYFFSVFNLPDGASMERTDQLMRRAEADLKSIPGIGEVLTTGGLNLLTNAYTSNNASIIAMLKPWQEQEEQGGTAQIHSDGLPGKNSPPIRKRFHWFSRLLPSMVWAMPPDSSSNCRIRQARTPQESGHGER